MPEEPSPWLTEEPSPWLTRHDKARGFAPGHRRHIQIKPIVWVRALSNRAETSAQLTTFHQAET